MPTHARASFSILLAALLASPASFAFQSPLSDEAVREAYFLGQRHDGSFPRLLDKYSKRLPTPKSGPYVRSITFLTPFAKLVHYSDAFVGNYSAQQAALDHRADPETVEISVEILLTDSYGPIIATPPLLAQTGHSRTNSGPTISGRIFKYRFSKGMRSACQPISPVNQPSSAPAMAIIAI